MALREQRRFTPAEYLAIERQSQTRSEFLDGRIFAMTGASRKHGLIAGNTFASLHAQLKGRACEAFASVMRVEVSTTGLYTYPDVVVVCGELQFFDEELDTLLNPTLIVEVLSPSTADYDRGGKATHYRALPSLRELLFVSQDTMLVEHWLRQTGEQWFFTTTSDPAATLELPSIGCALRLEEIYERALGG